eukprot:scaffold16316_cov44-Prasinocladus_malaysianus.AAC.2
MVLIYCCCDGYALWSRGCAHGVPNILVRVSRESRADESPPGRRARRQNDVACREPPVAASGNEGGRRYFCEDSAVSDTLWLAA